MNRPLKMTLTTLVAVTMLGAFTACGSDDSPSDEGSKDSTSAAGLETLKDGALLVGFRSDDKPISFIENGKATGFMIEVMDAIAEEAGLKPSYEAKEFASLLPDVRNHLIDVAAFDTLVTPERKKVVDFVGPINFRKAQLLSQKASALSKVTDADGHTIAITRGSALIPLLEGIAPDATIKEFPNVAASVNALSAGTVDGLFTGGGKAAELMHEHTDFGGSNLVTSGESAFPVAKDHPKLKKALNDALKTIVENGTYKKLHDKWLDADIPSEMHDAFPGLK